MKHLLILLVGVTFDLALAQPTDVKLSSKHDGQWTVILACSSVKEPTRTVKGYENRIQVAIAGGQINGRYDPPPGGGHMVLSGQVEANGAASLSASGLSGQVEFSAGNLAAGTPYHWALHGKLEAQKGTLVRTEGRPCTAEFRRLTKSDA